MNTVEPIRDMDLVMDLADYLKSNNERDYVLFMFGIYTGLRISDILKFRVRDVKGKDAVYIREKKTGKEKRFPINSELRPVIDEYISGKADDVRHVMTDMLSSFKTRMMNIPAKVAPVLEDRDAGYIKERLTSEVTEALNELKDYNPADFYSDEYVEGEDDE